MRAIEFEKREYGEECVQLAVRYFSLGVLYKDLGKLDDAKEILEKSINLCKKYYGCEHPHYK